MRVKKYYEIVRRKIMIEHKIRAVKSRTIYIAKWLNIVEKLSTQYFPINMNGLSSANDLRLADGEPFIILPYICT